MYVAYVLFYIYEKLTWMDGWMDNISDDLKWPVKVISAAVNGFFVFIS